MSEFPQDGGPQSWAEMRRVIKRRKKTVNKRNAQIWDLKGKLNQAHARIEQLLKENEIMREALESVKGYECMSCPSLSKSEEALARCAELKEEK